MICPLMSYQYKNIGEFAELTICQEKDCAWWIKKPYKKGCCVIKLFGTFLEEKGLQ